MSGRRRTTRSSWATPVSIRGPGRSSPFPLLRPSGRWSHWTSFSEVEKLRVKGVLRVPLKEGTRSILLTGTLCHIWCTPYPAGSSCVLGVQRSSITRRYPRQELDRSVGGTREGRPGGSLSTSPTGRNLWRTGRPRS